MLTDLLVSAGERAKRLDVFLVNREPRLSRSALQRLILTGRVRLNGQTVKPGQKIKPGDRVVFDRPVAAPIMREGRTVPLEILHEDEYLIVVNKPSGLVVHPTSGHWSDTLLNALLAHIQRSPERSPARSAPPKPGMVHRLDKDTSGVMVVAMSPIAHRGLAQQFERHTITRVYEALVSGRPASRAGVIDLAIGRDVARPKTVSTHTETAKSSVTEYEMISEIGAHASHVRLRPRTGRTHQLRVHLNAAGHPILGDRIYRCQVSAHPLGVEAPRLMLHACSLGFTHPVTNQPLRFTTQLPEDMSKLLSDLHQARASSGS